MLQSAHEMLTRATAPEDDTTPMPRSLLVYSHQDDEFLALGARMGRFAGAHMIHVTDGAPRNEQDSRSHGFPSFEEYRAARAAELDSALRLAGVEHMSRECLDIPDQQAAFQLPEITCGLLQRMEQHRPEVVFTHPYEGGHPDHDACAFAVHLAVAIGRRRGMHPPLIVESPFYHGGSHGIQTGAFLPSQSTLQIDYALSPKEQQRKQARIDCFTTQRQTMSYFSCAEERFRLAPDYDFTRPPHPPPVFYDQYPWGTTSDRFSTLAAEAQRALTTEAACR